jgi:hypothetical protein
LQEAFLLQMNDFDRYLEAQLRRMLDPVVATRPPTRGRGRKAPEPSLAVEPPALVPAVETVPVTVAATPLAQL